MEGYKCKYCQDTKKVDTVFGVRPCSLCVPTKSIKELERQKLLIEQKIKELNDYNFRTNK